MAEITRETVERFLELCRRRIESGIKIIITGHDMPDADSIISSVMMKKLLDKSNIRSEIRFSTPPDSVTARTCEELIPSYGSLRFDGFDEGCFDGCQKCCELILVDHHFNNHGNYAFACVDHHTTPPQPTFDFFIVHKASSCGRIIWDMLEKTGQNDRESELLALYSVYTDTVSCRSLKYDKRDDGWCEAIISRYGVDREWLFRVGMMLNSPDEDADSLALCCLKKYSFGGRLGGSNVLQVDDEGERAVQSRFDEIFDSIARVMRRDGYSIWAYVISNIESQRAAVHFFHCDGDRLSLDRTVSLDRIASRSRDVVPYIKSYLEEI